jgi:hypothetical protein
MRALHVTVVTVLVMTITKIAIAQVGPLPRIVQSNPPPQVTNLHRIDVGLGAPPACALSASLTSVPAGGATPSTLTWSTTSALRVTLNGGTVAGSGTLSVRPLTDATYTLTAYGASGAPMTCQQVIRVPQPSCANGSICPVACGTGLIPDIRSGTLLNLPRERMVHVLLVAEGYTAADLARFHTDPQNDVANWMLEWGRIDVYNRFREAFCIWKLPAVSSQRIVPGGTVEDTAFRVPVDTSGDVDLSDPLALADVEDRVWQQVARLPFPPTTFYPTTASRTRGMAKSLVVAAMLYESARGKSGYSGTTALLTNPASSSQTVATAFAHHRTHEFTHAFARLRDEYVSLDGNPTCQPTSGAWTSANVSNVVCTSSCSALPWSHLIAGGVINSSLPGLVGAFGVDEEGYHSELKCLMNGDRSGNATVFGGETELRDEGRMCNFCRELTAFRLFERIGELGSASTSYATWQSSYRQPFFAANGLDIPATVPLETPPGRPVFLPCVSP